MATMTDPSPLEPEPIGAGTLFREHAAFVGRFLQRLGVPMSELDDLLQEVFIVAHRKGGYVPGPAKPRGWLAAIALRIAQAGRRAQRKREPAAGEVIELLGSPGADPAEKLELRRALDRVQRALDALPLEQRAVFVLFEIEGESCEGIAQALAIPTGTVYSRLHHARRRFLTAYEAQRAAAPSPPPCAAGEQ